MKIFKLQPPKWAYLLFLIGLASIITKLILSSPYANSAVLYVTLPFAISFGMHHFIGYSSEKDIIGQYYNHMRNATIIMLGTSAVLFEGFICVLFFMPIYYIIVSIGFAIYGWAKTNDRKSNQVNSYILPAIIIIISMEGTSATLSFPRENQVTHTQIIATNISSLKIILLNQSVLIKEDIGFLKYSLFLSK